MRTATLRLKPKAYSIPGYEGAFVALRVTEKHYGYEGEWRAPSFDRLPNLYSVEAVSVDGPAYVLTDHHDRGDAIAAADLLARITGLKVKPHAFAFPASGAVSHAVAVAALMIWEEMLDRMRRDALPQGLQGMLTSEGTCTFRERCLTWAAWAEEVYACTPEDDRDGYAYDWEIIPALVDLIKPDGSTPTPETAAKIVADDLKHA